MMKIWYKVSKHTWVANDGVGYLEWFNGCGTTEVSGTIEFASLQACPRAWADKLRQGKTLDQICIGKDYEF